MDRGFAFGGFLQYVVFDACCITASIVHLWIAFLCTLFSSFSCC